MTATVPTGASATEISSRQKLTPEELDQARLFLEQTRNSVIGVTKGLTEAQWRFKPAPDRWSIAENLDHIVIVLERVLGPIFDQLAAAPASLVRSDCQAVDAIAIHQFPTRLAKFSAPEFVRPAEQIIPAELLVRLDADYARLLDRLESTPGLRECALDSAPLKAVSKGAYTLMDGYQWILTAAAHTERHAKQMLEVIADDAFPEG